MTILITGGTGLIGRELATKLSPAQPVFVLTRDQHQAQRRVSGQNITFISSIDELGVSPVDAVINLAGEPIAEKRWTPLQKQRITQSRWDTTQEVVNYIQSSPTPPSVLISGSAIGYYGRQPNQPIFEDFNNPTEEFSHYLCKRWEEIALEAQSPNTRVCLLRTGIVLDKHQGALAKMLPAFKFGLGGPMAGGQQFMSWIHLTDMVDAICFLLNTQQCQGVYNLTAPTPVTNLEFSQTLASNLHRPCLFPMPKTVLRLLFGEMADLLIYGQNVIPKKLMDEGFTFKFPSLDSAISNLLKN